jgi:hypothetical protein
MRKWEDNIKTETYDCTSVDSIEVAQDTDKWRAVVNTVMNLRVA